MRVWGGGGSVWTVRCSIRESRKKHFNSIACQKSDHEGLRATEICGPFDTLEKVKRKDLLQGAEKSYPAPGFGGGVFYEIAGDMESTGALA